MASCEVILKRKQSSNDFNSVAKEWVRERRHAPVKPYTLVPRDLGQELDGSVSQMHSFGWNRTPNPQDDCKCFGSGFFTRKTFFQLLIHESTQ
jgi:hypothetical protein